MIKYIKNLFKSKENDKNKKILDILINKYNEYGYKLGIIYVTKEELGDYFEYILHNTKSYPHITLIQKNGIEFLGIKVDIDPSILREEKLNQLGI